MTSSVGGRTATADNEQSVADQRSLILWGAYFNFVGWSLEKLLYRILWAVFERFHSRLKEGCWVLPYSHVLRVAA